MEKEGRKEERKEGRREDSIEETKRTLGHEQQDNSICHNKGVIIIIEEQP